MSRPTKNDLKEASRTKKYASGLQKHLKSHLGKSKRVFPSRPIRKIRKSYKVHRKDKLVKRLFAEGWLRHA